MKPHNHRLWLKAVMKINIFIRHVRVLQMTIHIIYVTIVTQIVPLNANFKPKTRGLIYHAIESIQRCTWHFVDWRANINKVNQQEYSYAYFEEYENRKLWTCSKLSNREGGYLHHNEMLLYPGTWPGSGQTCRQLKLGPILLTWINFNPNFFKRQWMNRWSLGMDE